MKQQNSRQEAGFRPGAGVCVDRRVRKVFARLATAPDTASGVLAREQNISVSWLGQLIKKETGATLRACIIQQRMQVAAQLLQTTELRVKEIAAQLGYAQSPSFVRIFARFHGQSPQQYRLAMDAAVTAASRPPFASFCALCPQVGAPAAGWQATHGLPRKKLMHSKKS